MAGPPASWLVAQLDDLCIYYWLFVFIISLSILIILIFILKKYSRSRKQINDQNVSDSPAMQQAKPASGAEKPARCLIAQRGPSPAGAARTNTHAPQ